MDVHSIKSDLVAMEMELHYHDIQDDEIVLADSKTPKATSHSTYHKQTKSGQSLKYVSLGVVKEESKIEHQKETQVIDLNQQKQTESRFSTSDPPQESRSQSNLTFIESNTLAFQRRMINLSTLNELNSCNSMFTTTESEYDYFFVMNTNVKVIIKSSLDKTAFEFTQPGHVIIAREEEMKQMANMMKSDWKGSLVMQRLLRHKMNDNNIISKSISPKRHDVLIELQTKGHEYGGIKWSSTLKRSIEYFYETGVVSIHNDSSDRDMVLALKFLKLVYTPNQLTFESFGVYLKFKLWSDYVICRKDIAIWIKNCLVKNFSQHKYMFVTHPVLLTNATFYCHGQRCEQLHGGLKRFHDKPKASYTVVHDLFAGDYDEPNLREVENHDRSNGLHPLRNDFKEYLKNELPGTEINFSLQAVTTDSNASSSSFSDHALVRPVLCIEFIEKQNQLKQPSMQFQRLPAKSISVLNRLDVSSLSTYDVDDEETYHHKEERRGAVSIDALTAEWLVGVFLCRASTDITFYDY